MMVFSRYFLSFVLLQFSIFHVFAGTGDTVHVCSGQPVSVNWNVANCGSPTWSASSGACNPSSPPTSGGAGSSALPNATVNCSLTINACGDTATANVAVDVAGNWNGSTCISATASFTGGPFSCTISSGSSSCSPTLNWTSSGAASVWLTDCGNGIYGSFGSGAQSSGVFTPYNAGCYRIQTGGSNNSGTLTGGTVLATTNTTASCAGGTAWDGSTCKALTCNLPWGGTINDGQSVTAYQSAAPTSACVSETRTCNSGTLSGSYTNQTCLNGCTGTPWSNVASGYSNTAYQTPSVPFGSSCVSETRTCTNGTMSGSYTNTSCSALPPTDCNVAPWGIITHGTNVTAYLATSPTGPCSSETRSCWNGTLSGSYTKSSCTAGCTGTPWGNVASGYSNTAYQSSLPAGPCTSETRTCSAGSLSGSYGATSCTPGCSSAAKSWGSCNATVPATTDGSNSTATDGTTPYTGSATYSCSTGTWTLLGGSTCVAPPTVSSFTNNGPIAFVAGQTGTLSWSSSGASSCSIDNGVGAVATNGSTPVSPGVTTTYTLTCTNTGGSDSLSTQVKAMTGWLSTSAGSCTIPAGQTKCSIDLKWDVTNAKNVGGSAVTRDNPGGTNVVINDDSELTWYTYSNVPRGTTNFYLYNNGYQLDTKTVTADCAAGSNWDSALGKCASTCSAISKTWGGGCSQTTSVTNSGSSNAITDAVTPYTGSATYSCSDGTWTLQGGSTCVAPPTVNTFTNNGPIAYNSSANLTYTSTGATSCTIDNGVNTGGSTGRTIGTGNITANTTYTLTCTNTGGTDTAQSTVVVHICGPDSGATPQLTEPTGSNACTAGALNASSPADSSTDWKWSCGVNTSCTAPKYGCTIPTDSNYPTLPHNNDWGCSGHCLNGQSDALYPACPIPTGTLFPAVPSCIIPTKFSSCPISFTWTTTNPIPGFTSQVIAYGFAGPNSTPANNDTQSLAIPYGGKTLALYNDGYELASTTVSATCSVGWDSINKLCVDPRVNSVTVTGQYYSTPGNIAFTCNGTGPAGSDNYEILRNGAAFDSGTYTGGTVNIPVFTTANYSIICKHGDYAGPAYVALYNSPPPPNAKIKLNVTPRTIIKNAQTVLTWDVQYPSAACNLTAKVVCTNNICTADQTAYQTLLNNRLATEMTDVNDPDTKRLITTAVKNVAPSHINTDWRALGRKTVTSIPYTTDFIYQCSPTNREVKRLQVARSKEG